MVPGEFHSSPSLVRVYTLNSWGSVLPQVLEHGARGTDSADSEPLLCAIGYLAMVTVLVAVLICVGHGASESEHALFWAIDACMLAVPVAYALLRCKGILGPESLLPTAMGFVWFLCLMTSLSAPSHRVKLLGYRQFEGEAVACEEGSAALWIGLLLVAVYTLVVMTTRGFVLLGSVISLQHLIVGLALPRPECSSAVVPHGGHGGALLGLPPLWTSTLQLLALTSLLAMVNWQFQQQQPVVCVVQDFIDSHNKRRRSDSELLLGSDFLAQARMERIICELEKAEKDCCDLVEELEDKDILPCSARQPRFWTALVRHLANVMGHSGSELKSESTDGDRAQERLIRAILRGRQNTTGVDADTASWLEHSYMQGSDWARQDPSNARGGGTSDKYVSQPPETVLRHPVQIETLDAIRCKLRIGMWDFDAQAVELNQHNVLQLVGFELLLDFSFLPRVQLAAFLEQLERAYVPTNSYHSHVHAADTCNAFWFLVHKTELWASPSMERTLQMACLIAALGHDVGHFARNNLFLVATRDALAVTYNDMSVLESFHASSLTRLLSESYGETPGDQMTLWSNLSSDSVQRARHLMTMLILGTDTSQHLDNLSNIRVRLSSTNFDPHNDTSDLQRSLGMIFRASDLSHSAKSWDLHQAWSDRLVQEFHEQGDEEQKLGMEISPLCDRHDFDMAGSQVGFLKFICMPTWKELAILESRMRKLDIEGEGEVQPTPVRRPSMGRRGASKRSCSWSRNPEPPRSPLGNLMSERSISGGGRIDSYSESEGSVHSSVSNNRQVSNNSYNRIAQWSWLAEVCVASCERNLEQWQEQVVSQSRAGTSDSGRTGSSRPGSPRDHMPGRICTRSVTD